MASKWSKFYGLGYFGSGIICAATVSAIFADSNSSANSKDKEYNNAAVATDASVPGNKDAIAISKPNASATVSKSFKHTITPTTPETRNFKDFQSPEYQQKLQETIEKARDLCVRVKDDHGLPGLVVGVSVNGQSVWDEGFGYADLENRLKMEPSAVMRIASISKSMTMAMMAKLMEEGKINIDLPIQEYLPNYPKKQVDGKDVEITTRHLLSHLSGIRHYWKKGEKENHDDDEMERGEYFLKDKFDNVEKSLELFQNDELLNEPGSKFLYTTHGFTVVSAIIEKITETPFPKYSQSMFKYWGLQNTYLDEHEPIIYNRTRYYTRDKKSQLLKNSPYVDNSYKWAGGGFLSCTADLKRFAHIMIASLQNPSWDTKDCENLRISNQPYLKEETIRQVWTGDARATRPNSDFLYGLGFFIEDPLRKCLFCRNKNLMTVQHSGAAIGASSILVMTFPKHFRFGYDETDGRKHKAISEGDKNTTNANEFSDQKVKGVVVAMLTNMTNGGLTRTALDVADLFEWLM